MAFGSVMRTALTPFPAACPEVEDRRVVADDARHSQHAVAGIDGADQRRP
jgi:hypothetical protein